MNNFLKHRALGVISLLLTSYAQIQQITRGLARSSRHSGNNPMTSYTWRGHAKRGIHRRKIKQCRLAGVLLLWLPVYTAMVPALERGGVDEAAARLAEARGLGSDAPGLAEAAQRLAEVAGQEESEEHQPQYDDEKTRQYAGDMVSIPGGTFRMGDLSGDGNNDETPVHSVTVPSFNMGKYEVTFAQWDACVADGGCGGYRPDDEGWGRGNRPVIHVSWDDIQGFIDWLNSKTGGNYRLPSEAEWEYGARAGSATKYHFGNSESQFCRYANHADSSTDIDRRNKSCSDGVGKRTTAVGRYQPNAFGLYDVYGNVWEWVEDCYNDSYVSAPTDGSAWTSGDCSRHVVRGGSWYSDPWYLRSALRGWAPRSTRFFFGQGFRLAQDQAARARWEVDEAAARLAEARGLDPDAPGLANANARIYAGEMVSIPGGAFRMGDLNVAGDDDERPVHSVTVPDFKLGKHEVTFAQWDACVADGGCGRSAPDYKGWGRGNRPVIYVSWDDIQSFIAWLNARTGGNFRLPTEAEWEYAARAGSTTKYSWGDSIGSNRANCDGCGSRWDDDRTAPVGSFSANAWGLHDLHGNVWEWVQDCWNNSYAGAPTDGSAWTSGDCGRRVYRGGSWYGYPRDVRSANRYWAPRSNRFDNIGFRLAQDK